MPAIAPLASPPQSQEQLLAQARQLAGYSLGELAALAGIPIPRDLKRDKGWTAFCWSCGWAPAQAVNPSRISPRWGSSSKRSPSTAGDARWRPLSSASPR